MYRLKTTVPKEIYRFINCIQNDKFAYEKYIYKINQTYYKKPIYVETLFDINNVTIGYTVFYQGYQIQIDNMLNEITIIN